MRFVGDERVARFVGERVGRIIYPPFTCLGTEKDGEIINGVIVNCFTGADCHITIAGHGWTKGFLSEVGHYVFSTLKCERMTIETEQPAVVRIAERLGGEIEGMKRNHFGKGRDAFVIGILASDYRF